MLKMVVYTSWFVVLCLVLPHSATAAQRWFYIINDFHYDPTYWSTQESCLRPIPESELSPWGHYDCDAPWTLIEAAIDAMYGRIQANNPPEFVVYMGDSTHHAEKDDTIFTLDVVLEMVRNVTNRLVYRDDSLTTKYDWPVITVIGNHDVWPKNKIHQNDDNGYYTKLYDIWNDAIPSDQEANFKTGGYYSRPISASGKVRVVVTNTCLYLRSSAITDLEDAAGHIAWLQETFQSARETGEKLHVMTHVPIGFHGLENTPYYRLEYHERFIALIRNNSDVIVGVHAVHEHVDSYRMFYDQAGNPVVTEYVAPAVVPRGREYEGAKYRHNPSFRAFYYDDTTGLYDNYEQYYFDLEGADMDTKPEWKLEYSFKNAYSTDNILPASMNKVLGQMKTDDNLFADFMRRNFVNLQEDLQPDCDCKCKWRNLCAVQYVDIQENEACYKQNTDECPVSNSPRKSLSMISGFLVVVLTSCLLSQGY